MPTRSAVAHLKAIQLVRHRAVQPFLSDQILQFIGLTVSTGEPTSLQDPPKGTTGAFGMPTELFCRKYGNCTTPFFRSQQHDLLPFLYLCVSEC